MGGRGKGKISGFCPFSMLGGRRVESDGIVDSSVSFFSGVATFSWTLGCTITSSSTLVAVDSSFTTWLDFNWLPGDAGGVIDLRLNGRLKMSTSD